MTTGQKEQIGEIGAKNEKLSLSCFPVNIGPYNCQKCQQKQGRFKKKSGGKIFLVAIMYTPDFNEVFSRVHLKLCVFAG